MGCNPAPATRGSPRQASFPIIAATAAATVTAAAGALTILAAFPRSCHGPAGTCQRKQRGTQCRAGARIQRALLHLNGVPPWRSSVLLAGKCTCAVPAADLAAVVCGQWSRGKGVCVAEQECLQACWICWQMLRGGAPACSSICCQSITMMTDATAGFYVQRVEL
eukprot:1151186-Pelagomonas_calceolata.AAC.8